MMLFKNIYRGIRAYGGTMKLINKLGLWKYFGVPILISLLTATGIGFISTSTTNTFLQSPDGINWTTY